MASAWGNSWGQAWGSSWGSMAPVVVGGGINNDQDDQAQRSYVANYNRRLSEIYRNDDEDIIAIIMAFLHRIR